MSIVKRRKTSQFAQIHNEPLQNLEDIRSIGLLSHLLSLPEEWVVRKMQLYNKFGRAAVTHAIKELEEKKFWIDIKYRDGKKNEHIYHISDQPFTLKEVQEIAEEVSKLYKVMEISEPFSEILSSVENEQLNKSNEINVSSIVDFQQFNLNCSSSTVENEHLLNKDIKINNNKEINNKEINITSNEDDIKNIVNKDVNNMQIIIDKLVLEYIDKGLSQEVCFMVVDEVKSSSEEIKNFGGYLRRALENTLYKSKLRNGLIESSKFEVKNKNVPFYNWLEIRD